MSLKMIAGVLLLVIGGWFLLNQAESQEPFITSTLPGGELRAYMARRVDLNDHPCLARTRCLVVYIAPWCAACQQTKKFVPFVRDAVVDREDLGFMVVVGKGWGDFNGGHDMAREIGGQVYLDADARYWKILRGDVNAIPAWLVFDGSGEVIETETGSPGRHDRGSARAFLTELGV